MAVLACWQVYVYLVEICKHIFLMTQYLGKRVGFGNISDKYTDTARVPHGLTNLSVQNDGGGDLRSSVRKNLPQPLHKKPDLLQPGFLTA